MDAWKARSTFDGADVEAWLTTLCLNRCRMRLRSRRRERKALEAVVRRIETPSEGIEESEFLKALATLPEAEREAFLLIVVQGMTSEQAGAAMDCSAASARSYLSRARQELSKILSR